MPVFFVCAGLLGLLAVSLTVSVGRVRTRKKINLGDGGDAEMLAAIRAHGNFMEFVPLTLLMIYLPSDFSGYWAVAGQSLALLIGRQAHQTAHRGGRVAGAVITTVLLAVASAVTVIVGIDFKQYG